MRRKQYPKITYDRAEHAAYLYLRMFHADRFIWRTTDFTGNSNSKDYSLILQELHRLEDNKIIRSRNVGDAGNIWWLSEREIPRKATMG